MSLAKATDSAVVDHSLMDRVEARIAELGGEAQGRGETLKDFPVGHLFTPGLYVRTIHMSAGSVLTSKIHRTEHPYVVAKGKCAVMIDGENWVTITAPYMGVTKAGTRRLLVILEDTLWTTFHPTELTDLGEIEDHLLEEHTNELLETTP